MKKNLAITYDKDFTTPILLLAFNRPEKTMRVFEMIRSVRPTKLYVAVDGPRAGRCDDVEKSEQVKEIVQAVDWPCETHYLFHEKNLGCTLSGVTAWNWIFKTEDRMLFIEDDGLGTKSAFYFIQELLERYKDDDRIAYIGGVNYGPKYGDASYFFSSITVGTYFMGTWKRVQELYDYDLSSFPIESEKESFKNSFINSIERRIAIRQYKSYIKSIKENRRLNTYDLQMGYMTHVHGMLSIYPNINMVTNIGFDNEATNYTVSKDTAFLEEYGARKSYEMEELVHPADIIVDHDFEVLFYKKRSLMNQHWLKVYFKAWFLDHFGTFYKKWIKPIRRR